LRVGSGPPLAVDSDAQVANLNADLVDGKEAPLVASVNNLETVTSSPDVVSTGSAKLRTGVYMVEFDREVKFCHRVASLGTPTGNGNNPDTLNGIDGEASTFAPTTGSTPNDTKKIVVATRNSAGALTDKDFQLAVFC
jgi:hypothetical protein